jgi:hypothetical protein
MQLGYVGGRAEARITGAADSLYLVGRSSRRSFWQRRGMMVDHPPLAITTHEDIGGLDQRAEEVLVGGGGYVLDAGYPRRVARHVNQRPADRYSHLACRVEDQSPALAHGFPAQQQIPTGMQAAHPILVPPHCFHFAQVHRLERAVERIVRIQDR